MITCIMFHDVIKSEEIKIPYNKLRLKINGILDYNEFENKIKYINNNFTVISLDDYIMNNFDINNNNCILTFDDGLKCHLNIVFPILKKYNLIGSFYISGLPIFEKKAISSHKIQFIISKYDNNLNELLKKIKELFRPNDNKNEELSKLWNDLNISSVINNTWSSHEIFITKLLRNPKYKNILDTIFEQEILNENNLTESDFCDMFYLNRDDIVKLHNEGMEIGGHGYYHNSNDTIKEINLIKQFLTEINVKHFLYSYPNGNTNIEDLQSLNFSVGLTTENDTIKKYTNKLLLPRINCVNIYESNSIALCGIQEQGLDICRFLINNNIKINYLITIDKILANKNNASGWVNYEEFSKQFNIPIYYCKTYSLNHEEDIEFFKKKNFNILLLGGWQRLLPKNILDTINIGAIGQHGSSELLPRCRGRSPINWSIILNRKRLVWNIFIITPGIDDGKIIDSKIIEINNHDDCNTMYKKIGIIVKKMYLDNIPKLLNNSYSCYSQTGEPTYYEKRVPEQGKINWNNSLNDIYNLVRAVTFPYPGAFTFNGFNKIMIWKCQPFDYNIIYNKNIGEIVEIFDDNSFIVNCCDGTLLITEHDSKHHNIGDILSNEL